MILFTDIDDTLVCTDKSLSTENRKAVLEFLGRGNVLTISTGRVLGGASALMKSLGLYGLANTYICACNGAQIFNTFEEKLLLESHIEVPEICEVFSYAREFGIHMQTYQDGAVVSESDNHHLERYLSIQHLSKKIMDPLDSSRLKPSPKLLAIDWDDPDRVTQFRSFLEPKVGERLDLFKSNPYLLEIVPHGVNKGAALRFLAERLSIPIENTVSAGDAENDLPMIKAAHIGCAMSNGDQRLKDAADYVTEHDNNHNGIAEILRKFCL